MTMTRSPIPADIDRGAEDSVLGANFEMPFVIVDALLAQVTILMAARDPDLIIGGKENPYLERWHLRRDDEGGCYLHRYKRDDDDRALHDHPWPSLSIMLAGALDEIFAPPGTDPRDRLHHHQRPIAPGDIILRPANFAHRLVLRSLTAVTLFVTGPRVREWGFWCPQGWRPWQEFTAPNDSSRIGKGCE